jgi:hypothetical protein
LIQVGVNGLENAGVAGVDAANEILFVKSVLPLKAAWLSWPLAYNFNAVLPGGLMAGLGLASDLAVIV